MARPEVFIVPEARVQEIKQEVLYRTLLMPTELWVWYELCRYYRIRTVEMLEALVGREMSLRLEALEGLRQYQEREYEAA